MWSFPKLGLQQNNENPKLDEFFNSQDAATSLVREALQNSLDAVLPSDDPNERSVVRVKFELSTRQWVTLERYFRSHEPEISLADHTKSLDLGKFAIDSFGQSARCLLVEDSGTKGLTGSIDKSDAKSGSNFVGFWWNRGITGKSKGSSGSHGVGKTTLTRASKLAAFLAITRRSDDNRLFLIGFSNLPYHRIGTSVYAGYGRYGKLRATDAGEALDPIEDNTELSGFSDDFGIDRSTPGLSILIPHVAKSIDHDNIVRAVLADYYWPVLTGALEIEVKDSDTGKETQIDAASIRGICENLEVSNSNTIIAHTVEYAAQALETRSSPGIPRYFGGTAIEVVDAGSGSKEGRLSKTTFTSENLELMKSHFQNGDMIGVGLSFPVEPIGESPQHAVIDVFLKKEEPTEQLRIAQYIRNQIVISNEKSSIQHRFSCAFLIADDEVISEYLKTAEEPAHTNWYIGRLNAEKMYESDWQLKFVKSALRQLYNVVMGFDEEEVVHKGVAADIFSVVEPKASKSAATSTDSSGTQKTKRPKVDVHPRRPLLLHVSKDPKGTGFTVGPVNDFSEIVEKENVELPIQLEITAAYLTVRGNAKSFKDYSSLDFDFAKEDEIELELDGSISVAAKSGNKLSVEITGSDFALSAGGFDAKRDLLLRSKINV